MRQQVQMLPPHQYYYHDDDGDMRVGTYNAELLREQKMQAVRDWNESQQVTVVHYNGHNFDYDPISVQRVMALALAGIGSPTGTWTTADNIDVPADAAFMQGLYLSMITHAAITHSKQRKMKNDLIALTESSDIAAYEVPV